MNQNEQKEPPRLIRPTSSHPGVFNFAELMDNYWKNEKEVSEAYWEPCQTS